MPGDILLCSLPHLIALPCQTRAERAKAPSPVPRSISWQSFESNCDCSALRSSEQAAIAPTCLPACLPRTKPALLWHPASNVVPCPGLALPLSSPTSSRDFSLTFSPSGPPLARLHSPVSSFQFPVSGLSSSLGHHAVPILPAFDLQPTWTARLHTSSTGCRRQS